MEREEQVTASEQIFKLSLFFMLLFFILTSYVVPFMADFTIVRKVLCFALIFLVSEHLLSKYIRIISKNK